MISRSICMACCLVAFTVAGTVSAAPRYGRMVYWSDKDARKIQRADRSTRVVEDILTQSDGLIEPRGLAIDPRTATMYWTDAGTGMIYAADLEGKNRRTLLTGLQLPADFELCLPENALYWSDSFAGKIQRLVLDGQSDPEDVLTGITQPYYFAIDPLSRTIYYSQLESGNIYRAPLDGGPSTLFLSGLGQVRDIVLDLRTGLIYWGDRDGTPNISYTDLARTGPIKTLFAPPNLVRPHGLALLLAENKLYWTDTRTYAIHRGNLDGTGKEFFVSGLVAPWDMVILAPGPDFDADWDVDLSDFAVLAQYWLTGDWRGDINADGSVNALDLTLFAADWLWSVDR
jgi:hypothetical protein